MALTPVNKIYSPDPQETPLARTQMSAMASTIEAAFNSLRAGFDAPMQDALARIIELEARPIASPPGGNGGGGGPAGPTINAITLENGNLVFKMSDGRIIRTILSTVATVITDNGDGTGTISS